MPPYFWLSVLLVVAIAAGFYWVRTQQTAAQRRSLRALYTLSEEIIAAASPAEIADKLSEVLPSLTQATGIRLYLLNRRTKSLESVPTAADPEPMAASIEGQQDGLAAGAVACFRNRKPLNIPDVRRNPLVNSGWKAGLPRSAMFVPLVAHQDTLGVLEASSTHRLGYFTPEEQATLEHLANQTAASMKLQEQKAMREQLFRSEKLAATGQLISGVAGDLRSPLHRIVELSTALAANGDSPHIHRDLKRLADESQRASEIVSRLVSFARPAESAARLVDVNALAGGMVQFREPEWKALGLRVQNRLSPEPAPVLGVQGQIEEVLLNLLVQAEQSASRSAAKTLAVSSSRLGGRVVVEVSYPAEGVSPASEAGLDVCRAIVQNHGGELRARSQSGDVSFDVDLPLAPGFDARATAPAAAGTARALTLMLVEPDLGAQRQILGLLAARGHRVIPASAEEAADLAHRFRFDGVVWAGRPGGADFEHRLRESVPALVLLSDAYDPELAESIEESGSFLLGRPIQEPDLERVLQAVEALSTARVS